MALEHRYGYLFVFKAVEAYDDASLLVAPWTGEPVLLSPVMGIKQKRFPAVTPILPPLDGILSLRYKHSLTPEGTMRVAVGVHQVSAYQRSGAKG